jgi:putative ABC transport system substrate-binding protein
MKLQRRSFIGGLGAAVIWPRAARAQQPGRVRRIGWLHTGSGLTSPGRARLDAFKQGLADLGWIGGRNLVFEERWANDDLERLRSSAADLAARRPDLVFVANSPSLVAMRMATGNIPIIFSTIVDPVGQGFVSSLAQPGGNITGFAAHEFALPTKNLELLKKMSPRIRNVAVIYDPTQPTAPGTVAAIEGGAASLSVEITRAPVRSADDIARSINAQARVPEAGLYVVAGPTPASQREQIISLAMRHRLPAVYSLRYFAAEGGLASYGSDDIDQSRRAASYADRILKGEKPADLPVQLPTKFELVLNLKTAKAMGLVLSPEVLALADEVIE